jgi:hypothetical protein
MCPATHHQRGWYRNDLGSGNLGLYALVCSVSSMATSPILPSHGNGIDIYYELLIVPGTTTVSLTVKFDTGDIFLVNYDQP